MQNTRETATTTNIGTLSTLFILPHSHQQSKRKALIYRDLKAIRPHQPLKMPNALRTR
jgi:hypothetical protein